MRSEPESFRESSDFLGQEIYRFNMATTGITENGPVTWICRDADGQIAAGIHGWTWGGCFQIHYLWVREELRGRGFGSRLLQSAEAEAREKGCRLALLDTHDFQAPGFYRKHGYEEVGRVDGYPPGGAKLYFRKVL